MQNSHQPVHKAGHYLILAITLLFGLLIGCSAKVQSRQEKDVNPIHKHAVLNAVKVD